MHYKRLQKHGDPLRERPSFDERFWSRVNKSDGCWEWTGRLDDDGYGRFKVNGSDIVSHRIAYRMLVGEIPDGLVLDHLCRNRACVNPDHLEPVTQAENVLRGVGFAPTHAAQTHCVNGHEFTPENTYIRRRKQGGRGCRACDREWKRLAYHRRKARRLDPTEETA